MRFQKLSALHIFIIVLLLGILSSTSVISYTQLTSPKDELSIPLNTANDDCQHEEENKSEESKDSKIGWRNVTHIIPGGSNLSKSSSQAFNHLHIQMEIHTPPPERYSS